MPTTTATFMNAASAGLKHWKERHFLQNAVIEVSYGEDWSLRKVLRRFVLHDRIHARAMYRMAVKVFGAENVANVAKCLVRYGLIPEIQSFQMKNLTKM